MFTGCHCWFGELTLKSAVSGAVSEFRLHSDQDITLGFMFQKHSQLSVIQMLIMSSLQYSHNILHFLSLCTFHCSLGPHNGESQKRAKEVKHRLVLLQMIPNDLKTEAFAGRVTLLVQVRFLDYLWVLFMCFSAKYN